MCAELSCLYSIIVAYQVCYYNLSLHLHFPFIMIYIMMYYSFFIRLSLQLYHVYFINTYYINRYQAMNIFNILYDLFVNLFIYF